MVEDRNDGPPPDWDAIKPGLGGSGIEALFLTLATAFYIACIAGGVCLITLSWRTP